MSRARQYDPFDEDQLVIPVAQVVIPPPMPEATNEERFEAFHECNPWVFESLVRLTEDWVDKGRGRGAMKMFVELLRWRHSRHTIGESLKINNNYTAFYVRLLAERRPDLAGVFTTRKAQADAA